MKTPPRIVIHSGYRPGDIAAVTGLHTSYYHRRWGFGLFFEATVAAGLAEFFNRFDPERDGFWAAVSGGTVVGAIAIVGDRCRSGARLRWFIVAPAHQGAGIGLRLLGKAISFCRRAGFHGVRLSTFVGLDVARHLYEEAGFVLTHEEEGRTWGPPVTEQTFELRLRKGKGRV